MSLHIPPAVNKLGISVCGDSKKDLMDNIKNHIDGGYILIARSIQCSEIWSKPSDWLKIWIYILQEVNYADNKLFVKGENFFNSKEMARECRVSKDTIHKFIKWAKSATLLATRKTTRGVVISVLNYAKYQSGESYNGDTRGNTIGRIEATQGQHRSHTIIEENKDNKENKEIKKSLQKKVFENEKNETQKKEKKSDDEVVNIFFNMAEQELWTDQAYREAKQKQFYELKKNDKEKILLKMRVANNAHRSSSSTTQLLAKKIYHETVGLIQDLSLTQFPTDATG